MNLAMGSKEVAGGREDEAGVVICFGGWVVFWDTAGYEVDFGN